VRAGINLASRPFVNARPVTRVTAALWALGALFALAAGWSFWRYFTGREDQRHELAGIEAAMERERAAIADLRSELAGMPLANQNERVLFLNQRIAERAFSWSLLFDRLAGILPGDVRLLSLAPRVDFGADGRRRGAAAAAEAAAGERVTLQVEAVARRPEAILELLDALFASPVFERPNLAQESRDGGETRFTLSVVYLPDAEAEPAAGAANGNAAGRAAGAEAGAEDAAAEAAAEAAAGAAGGPT
jgi:Tfp pilus assembly protein PilN